MGRIPTARAALVALAACGSPPPPGAAPSDRIPPSPVANDCPAVGSPFGNAWFYAQDLQFHRSCQVYLEQDECVVAIWDDCTVRAANTQRAWEGRIDLVPGGATRFWMRSQSRGSGQETRTCQGTLELEVPAPRALLDCEEGGTTSQMYLERVTTPAPLGESIGTLSTRNGMAEQLIAFTPPGGLRMVAAVSELALADGGGLYLFRETSGGDFVPAEASVPYGYLQIAAASVDGALLVAGGPNDLIVLDNGTLQVVERLPMTGVARDRVTGIAMTGANEMVVAIRRESVGQGELQRYQIRPLLAVGPPEVVEETQIERLLGGGLQGPSLFLFAKRRGEAWILPVDEATLEVDVLAGFQLPSADTKEVRLAESGAVALFVDTGGFGELSLMTGQVRGYFPVPYLESTHSVGYDRVRNWLLAGGVQGADRLGAVYAVDRTSGRPIPRPAVTNEAPFAVAVEGDLLFALTETRIYQVRLPSD